METLKEMFEETLKDVYFAENAIIKALPKMAEKAQSEELKTAFEEHLEETKGQVRRLDKIFKMLGGKAEGKECPALKGLVQETEELMGEAKNRRYSTPVSLAARKPLSTMRWPATAR
jgi:ferritin-like metal-binding protein YciE